MERIKSYYQLVKPGVLYGNVLTGAAGFLLAAHGHFDVWIFLITIIGMSCVVGSACALNNFLDRDIDRKMTRTMNRPSASGAIRGYHIVLFSALLGIVGIVLLTYATNWLVVLIGMIGFVTYVWFYGAWTKRQSVYGTIVGSISGAMPILGGYVAARGRLDLGAFIVFMIMFFWQFPEFYSIAIYRQKEYAAAEVPVISVVKGKAPTIRHIYVYTILYVVATLSLTLAGYTGMIYFIVMLMSGGYWIYLAMQGLETPKPDKWAKKMFRYSMIEVLLLCVMLAIGPILF